MCLAVPVQIQEVLNNNEAIATLNGLTRVICISLLEDVKEGDYVILHVGFALNKLNEEEAKATLALLNDDSGEY